MHDLKTLHDTMDFEQLWNLYRHNVISVYVFVVLCTLYEDSPAMRNCLQYVVNLTTLNLCVHDENDFQEIVHRTMFCLNYVELALLSDMQVPTTTHGDECSICMSTHDPRFSVRLLCGHKFCTHCVMNHVLHKRVHENHIEYMKYFFGFQFKSYTSRSIKKYGRECIRMDYIVKNEKVSTCCPYRCGVHEAEYLKKIRSEYQVNHGLMKFTTSLVYRCMDESSN